MPGGTEALAAPPGRGAAAAGPERLQRLDDFMKTVAREQQETAAAAAAAATAKDPPNLATVSVGDKEPRLPQSPASPSARKKRHNITRRRSLEHIVGERGRGRQGAAHDGERGEGRGLRNSLTNLSSALRASVIKRKSMALDGKGDDEEDDLSYFSGVVLPDGRPAPNDYVQASGVDTASWMLSEAVVKRHSSADPAHDDWNSGRISEMTEPDPSEASQATNTTEYFSVDSDFAAARNRHPELSAVLPMPPAPAHAFPEPITRVSERDFDQDPLVVEEPIALREGYWKRTLGPPKDNTEMEPPTLRAYHWTEVSKKSQFNSSTANEVVDERSPEAPSTPRMDRSGDIEGMSLFAALSEAQTSTEKDSNISGGNTKRRVRISGPLGRGDKKVAASAPVLGSPKTKATDPDIAEPGLLGRTRSAPPKRKLRTLRGLERSHSEPPKEQGRSGSLFGGSQKSWLLRPGRRARRANESGSSGLPKDGADMRKKAFARVLRRFRGRHRPGQSIDESAE